MADLSFDEKIDELRTLADQERRRDDEERAIESPGDVRMGHPAGGTSPVRSGEQLLAVPPREAYLRDSPGIDLDMRKSFGPENYPPNYFTTYETLRRQNITDTGAPSYSRFLAALPTDGSDEYTYKAVLHEAFGKDVDVKYKKEDWQKGKGELVWKFKDEDETAWKSINPRGVDLGDIFSIAPEAFEMTASVLGGVGGLGANALAARKAPWKLIKNPATAGVMMALGESGGAYLAKLMRYKFAESANVPIKEKEWHNLIEEAGLEGAGSLAIGLAMMTMKRILGRIPQPVMDMFQEGELDEAVRVAQHWKRENPNAPGLTVSQAARQSDNVSEQTVDAFSSLEGDLSRGMEGRALNELAQRQRGYVEDQLQDANSQLGLDVGKLATGELAENAGEVGSRVRQAVDQQKQRALGAPEVYQPEAIAQQVQNAIEDSFRQRAGAGPNINMADVRGFIQNARDILFDKNTGVFSRKYRAIETELRRTQAPMDSMPSLQEFNQKWKKDYDKLLVPSAAKEDVGYLEEIIKRYDPRSMSNKPTLYSINQDLSNIRAIKRARANDPEKAKQFKFLDELEVSLEKDRALILQKNPQLKDTILQLENEYSHAQTLFNKGIVAKFMSVDSYGIQFAPEKYIDELLASSEAADSFVKAATDVAYTEYGMDNALRLVKEGIIQKFRTQVFPLDEINKQAAKAQINAARSFIEKYKPSLRKFFTENEIMLMERRPVDAGKQMIKAIEKRKEMQRRIEKEYGVIGERWSSDQIVDKLWGNWDALKKVNNILRSDPDLHREFQSASLRAVWQKTNVWRYDPGSQSWHFDPKALENLLSGGNKNLLPHIKTVFGENYLDSMRQLNRALKVYSWKPGKKIGNLNEQGFSTALQGYGRFLRVIFPPLAPRGRALTAVKGLESERAKRAVAKLLSDPAAFAKVARLQTMKPNDWKAVIVLKELGFPQRLWDMITQSESYVPVGPTPQVDNWNPDANTLR